VGGRLGKGGKIRVKRREKQVKKPSKIIFPLQKYQNET